MKLNFLFLFFCLGIVSCKSPEARSPVVKKSGKFLKESVERNKEIQLKQEEEIQKHIQKDSLSTYYDSFNGFWYKYVHSNTKDTTHPDFGDLVKFSYDIATLEGNPIYSKEEIGNREYYIDQEDLFIGMRKGLKLMKEGETVTFLFPSSVAFGYYGDENKIGTNLPIKSTVTLIAIEKHNN